MKRLFLNLKSIFRSFSFSQGKRKGDQDSGDWILSSPVKTWPCPSCDRVFSHEDYMAMRYATHVAEHFNSTSLVVTPSPSPSSLFATPLSNGGSWPDVISPHLPPPPPYRVPETPGSQYYAKVKHFGYSFTPSPSSLSGLGSVATRPGEVDLRMGRELYNCDHCHHVFVAREDYLAHLEYLLANPVVKDVDGETSAREDARRGVKRDYHDEVTIRAPNFDTSDLNPSQCQKIQNIEGCFQNFIANYLFNQGRALFWSQMINQ